MHGKRLLEYLPLSLAIGMVGISNFGHQHANYVEAMPESRDKDPEQPDAMFGFPLIAIDCGHRHAHVDAHHGAFGHVIRVL